MRSIFCTYNIINNLLFNFRSIFSFDANSLKLVVIVNTLLNSMSLK